MISENRKAMPLPLPLPSLLISGLPFVGGPAAIGLINDQNA